MNYNERQLESVLGQVYLALGINPEEANYAERMVCYAYAAALLKSNFNHEFANECINKIFSEKNLKNILAELK